MTAYDAALQFVLAAVPTDVRPYGDGHINQTFVVETAVRRYILQRISRVAFKHPEEIVENIDRVTSYLRNIIVREGGDPDRETLTLLPTKDGQMFYRDEAGEVWRMYLFVEDTVYYNLPDTLERFAGSGAAFGQFQRRLSAFPAHTLHEAIHNFHNTPARYQLLMDAVQLDKAGRLSQVAAELAFATHREPDTHVLLGALANGAIPLRVTHNDTKLNNVLFDAKSGNALCVIDLDTVMPGLSAYDYGDSIRFGANTAAEDETDLAKVRFNLPMAKAFIDAFLEAAGDAFSPVERQMLPWGAKLMTFECGIRFLTDYLNGDIYFRTHYPQHNLDRARNQFALVADMERHWDEMMELVG